MTRQDDDAVATHDHLDQELAANLRALRRQSVPPRAVDANLRDFARGVWLLMRDADEGELRRATEAAEIECNVQLANVAESPQLTPIEAAAMPTALFGAVNFVRMVLKIGTQDAAEHKLGHVLRSDDYSSIALMLLEEGEVTGAELAQRLGISEATVSRRLSRLREMGAVHTVRGTKSAHSALTRAAARAFGSLDKKEMATVTKTMVRRRLDSYLADAERVDVATVEREKVKLERSGTIPVGDVHLLMRWNLRGSER